MSERGCWTFKGWLSGRRGLALVSPRPGWVARAQVQMTANGMPSGWQGTPPLPPDAAPVPKTCSRAPASRRRRRRGRWCRGRGRRCRGLWPHQRLRRAVLPDERAAAREGLAAAAALAHKLPARVLAAAEGRQQAEVLGGEAGLGRGGARRGRGVGCQGGLSREAYHLDGRPRAALLALAPEPCPAAAAPPVQLPYCPPPPLLAPRPGPCPPAPAARAGLRCALP
jgi:hypothetical protein